MSSDTPAPFCGMPLSDPQERIQLGHGAGTRLTRQLLQNVFYPAFANAALDEGGDSAVLDLPAGKLAFTTDAYVVNPLEFAGGNIGTLAVCGTINDLAMVGAMPRALSASFILEEGLPLSTLRTVVATMAEVARQAGVNIVTGDTKVVERGKGDGIFITTSGVGQCLWKPPIAPAAIEPGDVILLSGDLGRHAVAIMAARQGFVTPVESDVACLHASVREFHRQGVTPHCMRDLTRGGLGTALLELTAQCGLDCDIEEALLPLVPGVRSVVEALGLDAWFLANEGRYVCIMPPAQADQALWIMRQAGDANAVAIGRFGATGQGRVTVLNDYGTRRLLRMPLQEPLPRIC
jgi:hydrogenase expression/formation protein HypE